MILRNRLLWQVKDGSNMKRTIATHEATLIAANELILQETFRWYDDWNSTKNNNKIVEVIKLERDSIKAKQLEN